MKDSSTNNPTETNMRRSRLFPAVAALVFAAAPVWQAIAQASMASQPNTDPDKVYLEHADRLVKTLASVNETGEYQVLTGNVRMRKGGMVMTCDSAHFYENSNSFEAFSNVRMEQGDTLFVFGDQLFYDGAEELATLFADPGKTVRLINRDVTLKTYVFYYDLRQDFGYYDNWGELSDRNNTLTSIEGEYHPATKDAWFYNRVELMSPRRQKNDTTLMMTDSLNYNTATAVAEILAPTRIVNSDGVILTHSGTYDTRSGVANLVSRSTVLTNRGNTLTGDTLIFDRNKGIGEAFGNVVITDSARQSRLEGFYGYYNDPLDSAFITGRAVAKEYSRGDTLFLHGDTIKAYVEINGTDSVHITDVFHRVRFFRSDIQGICDSLSATDADSLLRMYRNPVIWSGNRQITGNVIFVHSNDSMPDKALLPEGGIMSEHIAEDCYNQLSGNKMTAWLNDSTIERLYVEGNVMMYLFPMENDSTYNKYVYLESSTMDAWFEDSRPKKINFWPETNYDIVPLYLAKRRDYRLQAFRDYADLRPLSPDDIFIVPEGMTELIESATLNDKTLRHHPAAERQSTGPELPESGEATEPEEPTTEPEAGEATEPKEPEAE